MIHHQSIQFSHCGVMNCAAVFPSKDLLPQSLPQYVHGLHGALSAGRFSPLLLKIRRVANTH